MKTYEFWKRIHSFLFRETPYSRAGRGRTRRQRILWHRPFVEVLESRICPDGGMWANNPFNSVFSQGGQVDGVLTSLSSISMSMTSALSSGVGGASSIPFVGNALGGVTNAVQTFQTQLDNAIKSLETQGMEATQTPSDSTIESSITSLLGPNGGLNILANLAPTGQPAQYVEVTHPADPNPNYMGGIGDSNGDDLEIEMQFTKQFPVNDSLSFQSGLPSLPISVMVSPTSTIQLNAGFAFELGLIFNGSTLSIDPNAKLDSYAQSVMNTVQNTTLSPTDTHHQAAVFVSATLSSGFSATATIGFLQGTAAAQPAFGQMGGLTQQQYDALNGGPENGLTGNFYLDNLGVSNPNNDPALNLKVAVSAQADANLQLVGGLAIPNQSISTYPNVSADFHLHWMYNFDSSGGQSAITAPQVSFDNVNLDLGSMISNAVGPIFKDIQEFTQPIQPVMKVLGTPLPGLTDLAQAIGLPPVTMLTLLQITANETGYGPLFDLIQKVASVVQQIDSLSISDGSVMLPLGGFDLNGSNIGNLATAGAATLDALGDPGSVDMTNFSIDPSDLQSNSLSTALGMVANQLPGGAEGPAAGVLNQVSAGLQQVLDSQTNGFDIEFPILQDPAKAVFGMLLGQDSDLVTLTAKFVDTVSVSSLPPLSFEGLGINYGGNINVNFNFKFAYDTYGIRALVSDVVKDASPGGNFNNIGNQILNDLADGFYIDDTSTLTLGGELSAGVEASIGIASASLNGSVSTGNDGMTPINIFIQDPNKSSDGGKLRFNDFGSASINATGELDAHLDVQVSIGVTLPFVGFVGYQKQFDIASVTLVNFNPPPPPTKPVLASQADPNNDDQVTLYIGLDADLRQPGTGVDANPNVTTTDGNENYTIKHISGSSSSGETIEVIDNNSGATQMIQNVKSIVGSGDVGNLTVTVDPGVQAEIDLHGGQGKAFLTDNGTGEAELYAGQQGGTLTGGYGVNYLYGTGGGTVLPVAMANAADVLIGGNGTSMSQMATNYLYAGAASAVLDAGGEYSKNYLYAGPGAVSQSKTFMVANGGINNYFWNEGDDALTVMGANPYNLAYVNQLFVIGGNQGNETWTVNPQTNGVQIQGMDGNGHAIANTPITATGIDLLSVDTNLASTIPASPANPNPIQGTPVPNPGNNTFTIGDLSRTGIQFVSVNGHEDQLADTMPDTITINGPQGALSVQVYNNGLEQPQSGNTENVTTDNLEDVILKPLGTDLANPGAAYTVALAIANPNDLATVNAPSGKNVVQVHSTAGPGKTTIHTDSAGGQIGNNQITVGDPLDPLGLDDILGPLTINAGNGTGNSLLFTEESAYQGDTMTLTANSLIRYKPITVSEKTQTINDKTVITPKHTRNSMTITYETDSGGLFDGTPASGNTPAVPGVELYTTSASDTIYVTSTPADSSVLINTGTASAPGTNGPNPDQVIIGYDGAKLPPDPVSSSTVANIHSVITVVGGGFGTADTSLVVADEADTQARTYYVSANGLGFSPSVPFILFNQSSSSNTQLSAFTLMAGPHTNHIEVLSTNAATTTAVDSGTGNNDIVAGDQSKLDSLAGPLVVNGGAGIDDLTLDDSANGEPEYYTLGVVSNTQSQITGGTFLRASEVYQQLETNAIIIESAVNISYSGLSHLTFTASNATDPLVLLLNAGFARNPKWKMASDFREWCYQQPF